MDSVPLVAITANVAKSGLGKDSFQEIDIVGATMPITKHNFIVKDIEILQIQLERLSVLPRQVDRVLYLLI